MFIQSKLFALGYYRGPLDGEASDSIRTAIASYKANVGMLATGESDFQLYKTLINDTSPILASHLSRLQRKVLVEGEGSAATTMVTQNTQTGRHTVSPLKLSLTLNNQPSVLSLIHI